MKEASINTESSFKNLFIFNKQRVLIKLAAMVDLFAAKVNMTSVFLHRSASNQS